MNSALFLQDTAMSPFDLAEMYKRVSGRALHRPGGSRDQGPGSLGFLFVWRGMLEA